LNFCSRVQRDGVSAKKGRGILRESSPHERRAERIALFACFALPFLIYLAFPARCYLPDGVVNITLWSKKVQEFGALALLFAPSANHYLFDLFAIAWAKVFLKFAPPELLIRSFQAWCSLFGALGAALVYLLARRGLLVSRFYAMLAAFTLAFCGAWWRYSHDAEDMLFSLIWVIASFYLAILALRTEGKRGIRWAAISSAVAIWSHMTSIFILPALFLLILFSSAPRPFRIRAIFTFALYNFAIAIILSFPHLVGGGVHGSTAWLEGAGALGLWGGGLSHERILAFAKSSYGSVVWLKPFAGMLGFHLLALFALIALITDYKNSALWGLVAWGFLSLAFALWWEPYDPEFAIPALIPLVALGVTGLEASAKHDILPRLWPKALGVLILIYILAANSLFTVMINRDLENFEPYRRAQRYAELSPENSILLSPTFDWESIYLEIYTGKKSLSLLTFYINLKMTNENLAGSLSNAIHSACAQGSQPILSGAPTTDARYAELERIGVNLKAVQSELEAFGLQRAFALDDTTYYRIECPDTTGAAEPR